MNRPTLTLSPLGLQTHAGWTTLAWQLQRPGAAPFVLTHALPQSHADWLAAPDRGDHALVVALMVAMRQGWDVAVEGVVSPTLLANLEQLQRIWHRWCPQRYARVNLTARTEAEAVPVPGPRPALFAFSGGVDASFTLFRHLRGSVGRNNRQPGVALFVHGMDIPLPEQATFDRARERALRVLQGTDVPLLCMRTNARDLGMDWEHSYGLQLGGCFLALQTRFSQAVKASGEPYEALVFPWGSTPMTDPLLSTAAMQMEHDGCESDRTEKVDWLARETGITTDLRVCWAGGDLSRNCGECEKCVRTMLNFWAMGHPVPPAFPTQLTPQRVRTVWVTNQVQLTEMRTLLRHALQHHRPQTPILRALQRQVWRARLRLLKGQVWQGLQSQWRQSKGG